MASQSSDRRFTISTTKPFAQKTDDQDDCTLLNLPEELIEQIAKELLISDTLTEHKVVPAEAKKYDVHPAVLATCQQMHRIGGYLWYNKTLVIKVYPDQALLREDMYGPEMEMDEVVPGPFIRVFGHLISVSHLLADDQTGNSKDRAETLARITGFDRIEIEIQFCKDYSIEYAIAALHYAMHTMRPYLAGKDILVKLGNRSDWPVRARAQHPIRNRGLEYLVMVALRNLRVNSLDMEIDKTFHLSRWEELQRRVTSTEETDHMFDTLMTLDERVHTLSEIDVGATQYINLYGMLLRLQRYMFLGRARKFKKLQKEIQKLFEKWKEDLKVPIPSPRQLKQCGKQGRSHSSDSFEPEFIYDNFDLFGRYSF